MKLELIEHESPQYAPRTTQNANSADLTVAFAVDFSTAGERLTKKAAGPRFVAIDLTWDVTTSARYLYQHLRKHNAASLNVAGNGMYTLRDNGWTERQLDEHLFSILQLCHTHWPLSSIRSGGQTGVDEAGLVVAYALGIPATGLYPRGFKQRTIAGADVSENQETLANRIMARAESLR